MQPTVFTNGAKALAGLALGWPYDLAVIDMQMPDTVAPGGPFLVPGLVTGVHQRFGVVKLGLNWKFDQDIDRIGAG